MTKRIEIPGIELGEELGDGAHSVVYRARQAGRACAVKLPRTRGRWTRWFYREAVALARVHHESLPAVLEVGEADGLPYLVMELVEGDTLAIRLARGAVGPAEALDITLRLAHALARVHDAGLVHRDVKPRNVLLEASGRVCLVDFGFAVAMRAGEDGAGTPGYAAPEQFVAPSRIDGRADLYALGRVLLDCLSSARAVRAEGADLASLLEIATTLTRTAVEERYVDAHAVAAELARVRAGEAPLGAHAYEPQRRLPPVVGRSDVIDAMTHASRELGPNRAGAVVVVEGARGSGKTHVLTAFAAHARAEASSSNKGVVVEVRPTDGEIPLATLQQLFVGALRRVGTTNLEILRTTIGDDLLGFAALLGSELPLLRDVAPPRAGAEAFAEGATEIFVRLASRFGPFTFVVDDYPWVDPVSRDIVERLAYRVREAPLLLVLGRRTALAERQGSALGALPLARTTHVTLPPLDLAEVASLIRVHLDAVEIDPALTRRVAALADATPLGVLEVLGAFLDVGAVRPQAGTWRFDPTRVDQVDLPAGALSLLARRLAELPRASRTVLETAAVIGSTFEDDLLARVIGIGRGDLEFALDDARRAGLVEPRDRTRHAFVHDSVREMLVGDVAPERRRSLHQQLAETLDATGAITREARFAKARHYARGELAKRPERAHDAARAAAEIALAQFDNETALRFLEDAAAAAAAGALPLGESFHRSKGEAQLRVGATDASLASFRSALELASDDESRAVLLGRIAWVHQTRDEPELAWRTLGDAFEVLGGSMPVESARSAARTLSQVALAELARRSRSPVRTTTAGRAREILSELHYQNARLGLEYGRPLRLLQSAFDARALHAPGESSRAHARARALYGFVLMALGRHDAGAREIARAREIAVALADPVTRAIAAQIEAMATGFAGQLDRAMVLFRRCLDEHGHWLELNEYCQLAASADVIDSIRGRSSAAWESVARAVERLRRSHRRADATGTFLLHRARAGLAALGRTADDDPWLMAQLGAAARGAAAGQGFHHLVSWGPRARCLVERGEVGEPFEELTRAFEAEKHNPRSVHLMVAEYYVAVVHGRIHQCLRAGVHGRTGAVAQLRRAAADLRAAAKIPLLKAHSLAADGYLAWFDGNEKKAMRLFGDAEALADQESCPWVLYAVARARAHMLREQDRADAARDQARVAEMLARTHGAEPRARFIREELGLAPMGATGGRASLRSSGSSASRRARRQLTSLLHAVRAPPADARPLQQASAILDDLLRDLDADAALLWFLPERSAAVPLVLGRNQAGDTWSEARGWREELVRVVRVLGGVWPPEGELGLETIDPSMDVRRTLAVPLYLYDENAGALVFERRPSQPPFSPEDRELLDLLSGQVPIGLEIARLLAERAQLQASLQQAQKMDAVGQLAGGVAHDFNNMLMVVKASLDTLAAHAGLDTAVVEELDVISQAAERAAELTRRLLGFSRHQPAAHVRLDVNAAIGELEPMLHRVAGDRVQVDVHLAPDVHPVETDRAAFAQALVNLTVNARDAMPEGGRLTITTCDVFLDADAVRRGAARVGDYVAVTVSDTGQGMSPEVVSRVFDPFFTTKPSGGGTGLGLTTVYAFAKNSGGHVFVDSEVGHGTTFRICLPRAAELAEAPSADVPQTKATPAPKKKVFRDDFAILVVDDEQMVRESVRRVLHRAGYRVLLASSAREALDIFGRIASQISLVILDVMMPEMTGPELAERLREMGTPAKVLFVSGYAPAEMPAETRGLASAALLQKPFASADLLERVGALMEI